MVRWTISNAKLAEWAREVIATYPPAAIEAYIALLREVG